MLTDLSIFSEETLDSIAMAEVLGGSQEAANNCQGGNCVAGCGGTNTGNCGPIKVNVTYLGCIKTAVANSL